MLLRVFPTSNDLTLAVPGTCSDAMEAALCNTIEPGAHAVIVVNGYFVGRIPDVAARCGADVHTVDYPWGTPVGPDLTTLEDEVKRHARVKVVGMVHAETSTGVSMWPAWPTATALSWSPTRWPPWEARIWTWTAGTWTCATAGPRSAWEAHRGYPP